MLIMLQYYKKQLLATFEVILLVNKNIDITFIFESFHN